MKDEVTYKTLVDETTGETKTVMVLPQQDLFDTYNRRIRPYWHRILDDPDLSPEYKKGITDALSHAQASLFGVLLPPLSIL